MHFCYQVVTHPVERRLIKTKFYAWDYNRRPSATRLTLRTRPSIGRPCGGGGEMDDMLYYAQSNGLLYRRTSTTGGLAQNKHQSLHSRPCLEQRRHRNGPDAPRGAAELLQ